MPILSYSLVSTMLILAVPSVVVVLAQLGSSSAYSNSPDMRDAWSVLGAMLATVVVAFTEGRPGTGMPWRFRSVAMIVSSAFVGSVGPGFSMHSFLPVMGYEGTRETAASFTWHGWATLGFILGLFGWGIVRGLLLVTGLLPVTVSNWTRRLFGIAPEKEDDK